MTNLFKRFFTHKSKFLLIIISLLGLAFSYSCSCRNDSTGHGNDGNGGNGGGSGNDNNTPTWSFAPKLDLKNSYDVSFTSDGTEKLHAKVGFTEPNKNEIKKIEIEEVKDPQNVLTKDNMQLEDADGKLTISKRTLKELADKLTSTDKPATNQVPIVFKLTSTNDTAGDSNIKYITNTFNFIKAKKIDKDNIQSILNKGENFEKTITTGHGKKETFVFYFQYGTYNDVGKVYTVTNNTTDNYSAGISKAEAKDYIGYNFTDVLVSEGIKGTPSTVDYESGGTGDFYILSYDITYGDVYEGNITPIKVRLENKSSLKFVE